MLAVMRKSLFLPALAMLAVLVIGVAVYSWGTREPAVARTHERAIALFNAMETYPGSTALDQAREASGYPGVDIVVARNTSAGHEIVLRITAADDRRNNFDWWPSQNAHYEATRCYRWTQGREWDTADEVGCPERKDIDPARAPRTEPISPRVDAELEQALRHSRNAATVRAQLADVDNVSVAVIDGRVAVAVSRVEGYDSGRPVRDCVLGVRDERTVQVWRPSATQVAPGEGSCDPAGAVEPYLQAPPH
jgi:hypothetical protein